jgi:hypothetical protein
MVGAFWAIAGMATLPAARPTPAFFRNERLSTILSPILVSCNELPADYSESSRPENTDFPERRPGAAELSSVRKFVGAAKLSR